MSRIRRWTTESFVPLLVVLLVILAATWYVDRRAEALADRVTVVRLDPANTGWRPDDIADEGASGEVAAEAVEEGGRVPDAVMAARKAAAAGDAAGAEAMLQKAVQASPGSAIVLNELGVQNLRAGRVEQAIRWLDHAVQADPTYFRARYNLGVAWDRAGDGARAEAAYRQAIEARPGHFESSFNLGLLLLRQGDKAGAATLLRQAVGMAGGDQRSRAWFSLGLAQSRLDRREEAEQAYRKAIEYQPDYLAPRLNLALLYAATGDAGDLRRAEAELDDILRLQPAFAAAWFLRGRLASREGDLATALQQYETASRHDPQFWKARYNVAFVRFKLGRLPAAEQDLVRLTQDFPDRSEPHFMLGRVAVTRDRPEQAVEHYRKAIEVAGGRYPEARLNLGLALRSLDRNDEALAVFDELLAADADNAAAHSARGLTLLGQGQLDAARQALTRAAALRPKRAASHYNLGKLESEAGRHEAAAAAYRTALALSPRKVNAAIGLGVALSATGDDAGAVEAYRKALDAVPSNVRANYNLGVVLSRLGREAEAAAAYERVVQADPDHGAARKNLGAIYGKLGRRDEAVDTLREALDRDPSDVGVRYNLALQYRKLGRVADAEAELARCVRLAPRHDRALAALASILLARDSHLAVVRALSGRVEDPKAPARLRTRLGRAYKGLGRLDEARRHLDAALTQAPRSVEALSASADLAERQGRTADAVDLLQRALEQRPGSKLLKQRLARLGAKMETP